MRFLQAVPEFQLHHGWKSIAGIAGAIGLSFVPGGAAFAPAVMAAGQAWDSADAAKKATKQVQGGYQQGVDVLSPYNARGNAAGDTLAGYLGIQAPPGGFGAPTGAGAGAGSAELPLYLQPKYVARQQAFLEASNASSSPQALQDFLEIAKRQQENLKTAGKATLNRPQTPSAKGKSSYGPTIVMPPIPQPNNVIWN